MKIKWGHFCERAEHQSLLWSLHGIYNRVTVQPGQRTFLPSPLFLVLCIEAELGESEEGQQADIAFVDQANNVKTAVSGVPLNWIQIAPGYRRFCHLGFELSGWEVPSPGRYRVVALVNKQLVEQSVDFFALPPEGSSVAPLPEPSTLRKGGDLRWAHLAFGAEANPITGQLSILQLLDFYFAPKGVPRFFSGYLTALLDIGVEEPKPHICRLEFGTAGGRAAHTWPDHELTTGRAGPGFEHSAFILMSLTDFYFPGVGDYEFRFYLNGDHAGTFEYPIVPPPVNVQAARP
jgi:hypothetical protein